jgi:hypothetical protein
VELKIVREGTRSQHQTKARFVPSIIPFSVSLFLLLHYRPSFLPVMQTYPSNQYCLLRIIHPAFIYHSPSMDSEKQARHQCRRGFCRRGLCRRGLCNAFSCRRRKCLSKWAQVLLSVGLFLAATLLLSVLGFSVSAALYSLSVQEADSFYHYKVSSTIAPQQKSPLYYQ